MKTETKKAILGVGGGILLVWAMTKVFAPKAKKDPVTKVLPENIENALTAFQNAEADGQSADFLKELNRTMKTTYGVTVSVNPLNGTYSVRDTAGKVLKTTK